MSPYRNQRHSQRVLNPAARAKTEGTGQADAWCAKCLRTWTHETCRKRETNQKANTASKRSKPRKETFSMAGGKGFFTDTTLCIGCKACEVACKQWNQLPDDGLLFTGMSYDNTVELRASTWRHVSFVERPVPLVAQEGADAPFAWLMMSDVGKHRTRP